MRAFIVEPPFVSIALVRVSRALAKHAPRSVELLSDPLGADVVVVPVVGRRDRIRRVTNQLKSQGQRYIVIQYCLRSTQKSSTEDWLPIWREAEFVWSYYDLPALCEEDGTTPDFKFYHAPLGVDNKVFKPKAGAKRSCVVATCGLSAMEEGVREAAIASERVGRTMFHLGAELSLGPHVTCMSGITDSTLSGMYSQCEYVSGLRRKEGFELPAAEGLLCGARPILFDAPHYRQWYGDWAEYIPENSRDEVVDSLESLFRSGARPVTASERNAAKKMFDWKTIVTGFWEQCQ